MSTVEISVPGRIVIVVGDWSSRTSGDVEEK